MELDFTVKRWGTDTSGRPIYATVAFWTVFQAAINDPRLAAVRPKIVVVQGAFMARVSGGGATASAGYHDQAGCIDVRTWNLTGAEQTLLWEVMDDYGIRFWKRDALHGGMAEHGHGLAVWDKTLAAGAALQAKQAIAGLDGLAGGGRDYMPRKHAVRTTPPARVFQKGMTMDNDVKRAFAALNKKIDDLQKDLDDLQTAESRRYKWAAQKAKDAAARQIAALGTIVDKLGEIQTTDPAVQKALADVRTFAKTKLADDPDVDGVDNPAGASSSLKA